MMQTEGFNIFLNLTNEYEKKKNQTSQPEFCYFLWQKQKKKISDLTVGFNGWKMCVCTDVALTSFSYKIN